MFQVLSDLHLELFPGFRLDPAQATAPYLLLAGDIGTPGSGEYASFLQHCSTLFERVFVVLGNHESYGASLGDAKDAAASACSQLVNVTLLDMDTVDIPEANVRVAGCTLWSHVTPVQRKDVQCFIADYRKIKGFDVEDGLDLHREHVAWLGGELKRAEDDGVRLVVLTHHAPLLDGTSAPCQDNSPLMSAFATDLPHLLRPPVALWVYGHTHFSAA